MSEDIDIFREIERAVQSIFGETDSLFDPESKSLRPLYRIDATEEEIVVTLDLPYVAAREDIELTSTEDTLRIEARTEKPVRLRVGGSYQRHLEFERFSKTIRLPSKVDPNRTTARFRNGILSIRFPLKKEGDRLSID